MRRLPLLALLALFPLACGPLDTTPGTTGGGVGAAGGGSGSSSCTTDPDTWSSFGDAFFSSECAGCHVFSHAAVQAGHGAIASAISRGSMPQGGVLDDTLRRQVLAYLACGAP